MHTVVTFVGAVILVSAVESSVPNIAALFPAIVAEERASMTEPCDDSSEQVVFDFVIVGAGTAGCVLANRLTEVPEWEVLLLEAGGEELPILSVPYFTGVFPGTETNWNYKAEPSKSYCAGGVGQRCDYSTGKVMGGSSSVNFMLSVRGNKFDYNNWETMGNTGWGYNGVLPYFKKVEEMLVPDLSDDKTYHSTSGNIKVSYPAYRSEISSVFVAAGKELGLQEVDYNGEIQTGISRLQTTTANGTRWSASRGYLHAIRDRQNLHIRKRSVVTKILITKKSHTAYGVEYIKEGVVHTVFAKKEVIVCAGAIKSPQLLMISGIGPRDHLRELNITLVRDLPVGRNLMDHATFLGLLFTVNQSKALQPAQILSDPENYLNYLQSKGGPLSLPWSVETASFQEVKGVSCYSSGWPNIATLFSSTLLPQMSLMLDDDVYNEFVKPIQDTSVFQALVWKLRPDSRGSITLVDKNIESSPKINPNFFDTYGDMKTIIAGIRKVIELSQTKTMQEIGTKIYDVPVPKCKQHTFGSDDYWKCAVSQLSISAFNPCGTCKMGPDYDLSAVVSPLLKVHGVNDLRVIDASVIPQIISGHLAMPVYMIAEKGADMIKERYVSSTNRASN
ncbi:glucose dehydrogenase [FAD, quinone]-like [Anabrus simplex]|uniref:glucose dehydrogenase [FAD, quinone]-like n=1 Tax=Anabrus simplex TaxID=316456 RepID=UPI0034DCF568